MEQPLIALRLSVLVVITSELIARGCAVKCKLGEGKGTIVHQPCTMFLHLNPNSGAWRAFC